MNKMKNKTQEDLRDKLNLSYRLGKAEGKESAYKDILYRILKLENKEEVWSE